MVLHDPALALCIGLVHSFDYKHAVMGGSTDIGHCHTAHATDTLMRKPTDSVLGVPASMVSVY